jgi:hypothetical protein
MRVRWRPSIATCAAYQRLLRPAPQRSPFTTGLAEPLRDRVFVMEDSERQLHIIFLVNDILFERYGLNLTSVYSSFLSSINLYFLIKSTFLNCCNAM